MDMEELVDTAIIIDDNKSAISFNLSKYPQSKYQRSSINETISNMSVIGESAMNFINDQLHEADTLAETMGPEMSENGDNPYVYTDTDEKPAIVQIEETKPEYNCDVCEAVFNDSSSIKEHMREHKRSRPLHCRRCDQYFVLGGSFRAHKQQHELEDSVQCPVCGKNLKNGKCLAPHMKQHENPETYECGICCKSFRLATSLIDHMQSHTSKPIYMYKCDICNEGVKSIKYLEWHKMNIHNIYDTNVFRYECSICNKRFKKMSKLTDHDWKYHFSSGKFSNARLRYIKKSDRVSTTPNQCDTAAALVSKAQENDNMVQDDMDVHAVIKSVKDISCNNPDIQTYQNTSHDNGNVNVTNKTDAKLSESLETDGDNVEHSTVIHRIAPVPMTIDVDQIDYKGERYAAKMMEENVYTNANEMTDSDIDSTSVISRSETPNSSADRVPAGKDKLRNFLDEFVANIMGYDDEEPKEDNDVNNVLKSYTCDLCSREFQGRKAIKEHMLQHNNLSAHYCTRCDLYFVLSSNMKAHLSQHEKEDPSYDVCKLCNEVFHTPQGLANHNLTHAEYFPFKCDVCQRGFQTQNTYDLHMRFHNNCAYECTICPDVSFASKGNLTRHMQKDHFIYASKKFRLCCDLCEKKFKTRTAMKNHKRYSHNIQWNDLVAPDRRKYIWNVKKRRSNFY